MKDLALGIDIGTTSVKSVLISKDGDVLFETSRPHDLISSEPGFAEEDPNIWWNSVKSILKEISEKKLSNRIAAIGITGMVPTLVLIDEKLDAIRNSIQQNDARSTAEIAELKKFIKEDEYFFETANTLNQQVIFPKILWLKKHEPKNIDKTRWIMGSYDFISTKLTGNPHVEMNWALESGMWLVREKKWYDDILEVADIKKEILPPVFEPIEIVGETIPEIEKEIGFPAGVPVIAGSADHIASSLAVGLREEGDLLLKFGGAGDIMFVTDSLKMDRRLFLDYHDIPSKYILNGCMAASGSLVKWYMNIVQEKSYDELTKMAMESSIGSRGLLTLPYFLGEKTPIFNTKARGVIFGLGLHHNRGDIFRSILESVAFGFKHHIEVLREIGLEIKRVFISDGGAKNPLWRQITADVVGMDVKYILNNPGSSLGVAFLAGASVGIFKNWNEIDKFITESEIVISNQKSNSQYEKYYYIYRKLYEILEPLYEELYNIKEGKLDEV
ncbi:MAG TPA: FGGY-family carbohydrate kinase [Thermoanaerobacter sp.]|nr:FGGY-family carbohydrate kinase [Thermoanaerobacter sp.]